MKKLERLKQDLRGNLKLVAERTGKTTATVSRVLSGLQENDEVIEVALDVRKELIAKKEKLQKKINQVK
jgi:uncharacterized protein YerC